LHGVFLQIDAIRFILIPVYRISPEGQQRRWMEDFLGLQTEAGFAFGEDDRSFAAV